MFEKDNFIRMITLVNIYIQYCESLFTKEQLQELRLLYTNSSVFCFVVYIFAPLFHRFMVVKSADGVPFPLNRSKAKIKVSRKRSKKEKLKRANVSKKIVNEKKSEIRKTESKLVEKEEKTEKKLEEKEKTKREKRRDFFLKRQKVKKPKKKDIKKILASAIHASPIGGKHSARNFKRRELKRLLKIARKEEEEKMLYEDPAPDFTFLPITVSDPKTVAHKCVRKNSLRSLQRFKAYYEVFSKVEKPTALEVKNLFLRMKNGFKHLKPEQYSFVMNDFSVFKDPVNQFRSYIHYKGIRIESADNMTKVIKGSVVKKELKRYFRYRK